MYAQNANTYSQSDYTLVANLSSIFKALVARVLYNYSSHNNCVNLASSPILLPPTDFIVNWSKFKRVYIDIGEVDLHYYSSGLSLWTFRGILWIATTVEFDRIFNQGWRYILHPQNPHIAQALLFRNVSLAGNLKVMEDKKWRTTLELMNTNQNTDFGILSVRIIETLEQDRSYPQRNSRKIQQFLSSKTSSVEHKVENPGIPASNAQIALFNNLIVRSKANILEVSNLIVL